jgi:hypothetical protein
MHPTLLAGWPSLPLLASIPFNTARVPTLATTAKTKDALYVRDGAPAEPLSDKLPYVLNIIRYAN